MSGDADSNTIEDEIEQEIENFQIDLFDDEYCEGEKENDGGGEGLVADSMNVTTNSLLRATICELERALKDTRRLLFDRDKENSSLRQELEKTRKDLRKEQSQRKKSSDEMEETLKSYKEIEESNKNLKREVEELKEKLEKRAMEQESQEEDPEEIIACCSSMNELLKMKEKFKNVEKEFEEFKSNNRISGDCRLSSLNNTVNLVSNPAVTAQKQAQRELQTQLRIKFLRDAFFYYMIDFHPDEQMKAILAILDYDDKRHDIIIESHKMKRQGKRFTVSEVSSRSLTFVQEHTL